MLMNTHSTQEYQLILPREEEALRGLLTEEEIRALRATRALESKALEARRH
jgi:hypothetical protein